MSLWLIRAGSHGEFEPKFLEENRVYVTWLNLAHDLHKLESREALIDLLEPLDPGGKLKKRINHASQIWPFAHTMQKGDWVERLTPATLNKAFRGDLVPQDPNDEPATVLLEWLNKDCSTAAQPRTKARKAKTTA